MNNTRAIGFFDSGIGGLTVAHAVRKILPGESFVYFGDTAHHPYGDKSTAAIQAYAVKICDILLRHNCKVILIACNSASSAAYRLVKEYVGSKAEVINVIDPVIDYCSKHYAGKAVGLIGTKKTVGSNAYQKKIDKLGNDINFKALATPLLAPMIEEGFCNNRISEEIIQTYLQDRRLEGIEALILGCTHYPLIKTQIERYYQKKVEVLDSSDIVAETLLSFLKDNDLLNNSGLPPESKFYVSDYTHSFAESARMFFMEDLNLEHYPLWE
ncbi:glutamate racemase [Cytophagaceae bacterium ABcell3]|nr:glutamate racemase [Cytophagaceae bacterium ABcell3]